MVIMTNLILTNLRRVKRRFAFLTVYLRRKNKQAGKEGVLPVVSKELYKILVMIPAVPFAIVVWCLRPIVLVRFGWLPSHRLGHFALEVEAYLCAHDTNANNQNVFDMFFYCIPICNQQVRKMWDRTLRVSWLAEGVHRINQNFPNILPWGKEHVVQLSNIVLAGHSIQGFEAYDFLAQASPHLQFTPEEIQQGHEALLALGIPQDAPFICFHARDTAYSSTYFARKNDRNFRNSNIYTRLPAVEELTHRGYWGLRMGAAVEAPLQNDHPRIIDYATTTRTDFLDIFLVGTCRFYLGDSCGLADVAVCFRRPVVWVNWIPLTCAVASVPNALFLPKKLWLAEEHRFMTFREMSAPALTRTLFHDDYFEVEEEFFKNRYGIEFIENTPDEITAVVLEMEERLQDRWQTTEEDEDLQRRFWAIVQPEKAYVEVVTRIGCEFLRQNRVLFD